MNRNSVRRIGCLAVGLFVAAIAIAPAPAARAVDDRIVLNRGMTGGPGIKGGNGNYDQTFYAAEILGAHNGKGGTYTLQAYDNNIPLSWEYYPGDTVKGMGSFHMNGTYDPATGAVAGRFTLDNEATGTIKGSSGDLALTWSMTWTGTVTGTIEDTVAALGFSGSTTTACTMGGDDCSERGTVAMGVWFTVAGAQATTVPGDSGENVVVASSAVGDVYLSPASEADLETSARTWHLIKPGDRISLTDGVMLRTGRDGTLGLQFNDTSRIRLQSSTLFSVQKVVWTGPTQTEVYTRLFQGIADFYMHKWAEDHKKFEVEVDRAIVSIQGTTWRMSVTDKATVVTVNEGVVTLTDKASGKTTAVKSGEQATVDATGTTKTAAPAATGSSGASGSLGTAGSPGASGSTPASSSDPLAAASPLDLGWGSGGSGPPIALLAAILAGIAIVAMVAVSLRRTRPRS